MKLSDFLRPDQIVVLRGRTKQEALDELVDLLSSVGGLDADELSKAVRQREEMMSTGIGHGLAIPHVRMKGLKHTTIAIGINGEGIADYKSLDDKPVRIVVLIAAPEGEHESYIRLLAKVTDVLCHSEIREKVTNAASSADIYDIFVKAEA